MMNKCAIVTGATKGIGLAIANQLVADGYHVIGTYVSSYDEDSLRSISQNKFELVQVDGSNFEECDAFIKNVLKENSIEVLVNNAGIVDDNLLMRMSEESFDNVIASNLKSVFNLCKAVNRSMMKNKKGVIINVSSVIGLVGNIGQANYAASKAGVIGFSKSLAKELASRNIRVNCIAPGYIETPMTEILNDDIAQTIKETIALKRFGKPQDVANAVSFLVSDSASYITGQTINICGGMVI